MTGLPAAQLDKLRTALHAPARIARWPPDSSGSGLDGGRDLWAQLFRQARCTESNLDADEWFPVSAEAQRARQEAAAAIAVCRSCPVRVQCLALSLRHWEIGRHGVWGGLVEAERADLRRKMLAHRACLQ